MEVEEVLVTISVHSRSPNSSLTTVQQPEFTRMETSCSERRSPRLPPELLHFIFRDTEKQDLLSCMRTCRDWLELGRPTIADIACFPYVALSHEGAVSLESYASVRTWVDRVKGLSGFIPMPAI